MKLRLTSRGSFIVCSASPVLLNKYLAVDHLLYKLHSIQQKQKKSSFLIVSNMGCASLV